LETKNIINLALIGHTHSGKTSLGEAILFKTGEITRIGKVEDGTTTLDFEPEEHKHNLSISLAMSPCLHKNVKINILDTPGYADFTGEVKSALRVCENIVMVLSAVGGVEVQSEITWNMAEENGLSKIIFVNKVDRENSDFKSILNESKTKLSPGCVAVQYPIGEAEDFKGIVDLIPMKAFHEKDGKLEEGAVPTELLDKCAGLREKLIDAVADKDDEIMEKYLDGRELTVDEIYKVLKLGIQDGSVVPILCGSATKLMGIDMLLDSIVNVLSSPADIPELKGIDLNGREVVRKPSPNEPFSALIFKTLADPFVGKLSIFRVYSGSVHSDSTFFDSDTEKIEKIGQIFELHGKKQQAVNELGAGDIGAAAKLVSETGHTLSQKENPIKYQPIDFPEPQLILGIKAKSKADEEKLSTSIHKLHEEDVTFKVYRDVEVNQTLIKGMGEIHLDVILEKLKRKFGMEAELEPVKNPYRETIKGKVKVQGKYKKQSGGRGQYGDCWIEVEPLPRGGGFEFIDKIFGGSIPHNFRPAVEKGVKEAMEEGILAGYNVVDLKITLVDGSYHPVDSSEMAFKIAGSMALKNALHQAQPVLLEPISNLEVTAPEKLVGDIIGDLNSKRGKVLGMEPIGKGVQVVKAQAPTSEMLRYSIDLRSLTGGRAFYKIEHSHYDEVSAHMVDKIVQKAKEERKSG
jgi:elongation factor G